jgi:MFS family permease
LPANRRPRLRSAAAAVLHPSVELLRHEREARVFFLAHAQSSLGTGAAYVGLLLLAYERFRSPWAITLVLLADFLPSMLLGPLFGAAADRWSRRWCAVAADVVRAAAFVGLGVVTSFAGTIALAVLAGAGTALFRPAILAALPALVDRRRLPAATSLYGALADIGHTAGPGLAGLVLLFSTPAALMIGNGATFALSALLLARLSFGGAPARPAERPRRLALAREAAEGLRATAGLAGVRIVVLASSAVVLFAGLFNVGELLLATGELGAGASGFSVLVAVFGLGVVVGSIVGARGGAPAELKRRYLGGILVVGLAFIASGLAPVYAFAVGSFAIAGLGNGLVMVHERLLLQSTVSDRVMGRVFAVKDFLSSWAFVISFLAAGAFAALLGTRPLFLFAGAGAVTVWAAAAAGLRDAWSDEGERSEPASAAAEGVTAGLG